MIMIYIYLTLSLKLILFPHCELIAHNDLQVTHSHFGMWRYGKGILHFMFFFQQRIYQCFMCIVSIS